MDDRDDYNRDCRGEAPPAYVLAMLTTPAALRARAAIRLCIAAQDDAAGDTLAAWRNRAVASQMLISAERPVS